MGVPKNIWNGYQIPFDGLGYAGLFVFGERNLREFIQVPLSRPLVKGKKYRIALQYVYGQGASHKVNHLSLIFSSEKISMLDTNQVLSGSYFPEISPDNVIEFNGLLSGDTLSWRELSQVFVAQDSARYLTIGNLRPNSETIYIVKLTTDDGNSNTRRLVVAR